MRIRSTIWYHGWSMDVLAVIKKITNIKKVDVVSAWDSFVNEKIDEWDIFFDWSLHFVWYFLKNLFEIRMKMKWMLHPWVYFTCFEPFFAIDSLCEVSTHIAWESIDKHLTSKHMFISDCKTLLTKFDGMDIGTRSLTGKTCVFWWMTLASYKNYINMKESQIRCDKKIAILPDICLCLVNDAYWWHQCWHKCCHMQVQMMLPISICN